MAKPFSANRKGFRALRRSAEVRQDLEARVERMADAIGEPDLYVADSQTGKNRARASLRSYGYAGAIHELETRALERSIDAGGDA